MDATALKAAINLLHVPSRVRPMRSAPLPGGVTTLLEIAAGDAEVTRQAAELTGRTPAVVREAAAFFVEQILLAPDADSYRVLGAQPLATSAELRRNMAMLLKWLHPDMERNANGNGSDRSMFAGRVTQAWDDLKTVERRAAYDVELLSRTTKPSSRHGRSRRRAGKTSRGGVPATRNSRAGGASNDNGWRAPGGLWRALMMLFGGARH